MTLSHGQLQQRCLLLDTQDGIETLPGGEAFWTGLAAGQYPQVDHGRLVSCFDNDADWMQWECHPHGEELVSLMRGAVDFVLEMPDGPQTVALRGRGAFVVVPRGIWHTANVLEASTLLFVTVGRGSRHRPR